MILTQNDLDLDFNFNSNETFCGSSCAFSESININIGDIIDHGNEVKVEKTTFDILIEPLDEAIDEIEKNRKVHHLEKLSFRAFVRLLVYYFVIGIESGRLLITKRKTSSKDLNLFPIKKTAFFDAFNRFPAQWFFALFTTLVTTMTLTSIPELQMLGQLVCVDGSIFPTIISMGWAEYKENKNALKLHLCFELNRMIPIQLLITAANFSEREALRSMLEAGVTYIADRGYVCFTLLSDIDLKKAFFVIRMRCNFKSTLIEQLTVNLPESVKHIFLNVTDQRVKLINAANNPIYRLVTFDVGNENYLVLTNQLDLTTFQVILLYAYRWQIELVFRFLKRSMKGLHLLSTSKNGVQIQFYMLLCCALLQLRLKQECITTHDNSNNISEENNKNNDEIKPESQDIIEESEVYPGLMIDPEKLNGVRGSTFLATIGSKLKRYWKIGIHWLTTLRDLLDKPFNMNTISLLADI